VTKTVLLVEDDRNLADGLQLNLEAEGYEVVHVSDGTQAVDIYNVNNIDLVLLDIMLPGVDGLTICRRLRRQGERVPVLFITARDTTDERVEGLIAGGDDYITKPFAMRELLARIQGMFRRQAWLMAEPADAEVFEFDGRKLDLKSFEASGPGGTVRLSHKECMVAKYLMERQGEVVSRDQLLDAVWGYRAFPTTRTIDNFILKLRKVFEHDPAEPVYLETVRGVGYRFLGAQKTS
jgi:DNA-binding response OmpR family regulator